ncbi:MAG: hypothetical protein ACOYOB_17770 [Myxococcota bacterium]
MKLRSCIALLSLAMLTLAACGSDSTGGTSTTTDTSDTKDIFGGDLTPGDSTADSNDNPDTINPGSDANTDVTAAQQCCLDKGADCGFVPGCPANCGPCKTNFKCDTAGTSPTYKCKAETVVEKKKFGEACGPDKTCRPPQQGAADTEVQAYRDCINAQCDTGLCIGVCTKMCTIVNDVVNNATGDQGADGVEDPGSPSDCEDAVDGPNGTAFKCIEYASQAQLAQGQSFSYCAAGTNFKPCKADSDCPATEACGLQFFNGSPQLVCAPKAKNPNGTPGVGVSETCNDDPLSGKVATCENNLCGTTGCLSFCKSDNDCVTAKGACKSGKCDGTGATCSGDADCSAWQCEKGVKMYSDVPDLFDVCLPKKCFLDKECGDSDFYCRTFYNGVSSPDGDPDPIDKTKITMPGWEPGCVRKTVGGSAKGQACDAFPNDNDKSVPICENPIWCVDGSCSGHCKTDTDCATNQKCGALEIPLDLSNPADDIYDVFLPLEVCTPMAAPKGECKSSADCKDATSNYCKLWEYQYQLPGQATGTTVDAYTVGGLCITPDTKAAAAGEACGSAVGKLCKSGLCLGSSETQAGYCVDTCNGKATCAEKITIDGNDYKTLCSSLMAAWGGTMSQYDDLYFPLCIPVGVDSTLSDCSATKKCDGKESCVPFPIATGPDKKASVEYHCLLMVADTETMGTKKPGESCNPDPAQDAVPECASGLSCFQDSATGKGYCTALCNTNADCGAGQDMICDQNYMRIPRKDMSMAALVPMCVKKKSCLPCNEDFHCNGGYKCSNTGAAGTAANLRCAAPCQTDSDCAAADSGAGAKCEPAKNTKGTEIPGVKVCTPSCK